MLQNLNLFWCSYLKKNSFLLSSKYLVEILQIDSYSFLSITLSCKLFLNKLSKELIACWSFSYCFLYLLYLFMILLYNIFTRWWIKTFFTLTEIFSYFRQKLLKTDCQTRFLHIQETIWGNRFFHFFCFPYIFGFWAKVLWHFS